MSVEFAKDGDVLKIIVEQDTSGKDLEDASRRILDEKGVSKVSLDLKKCFYIQSKALAALIAFKKNSAKIGAEFTVTNVCENVFQVLEMANLTMYFTIEEDFSTYTPDELIEKFFEADYADRVSDYIVQYMNDDIRNKLYEILDSEDPTLKYYAILTLGRAHDYSSEDKIKAALESDTPQVAKAAVLVLGWFGDTDSKEKMYEFLDCDVEELREAAAASIALLSDDSDAERLGKLLQSDDPSVRTVTVQALTLINDTKAFNLLVDRVDKEENEAASAALIRAISSFNKEGVSDILIKALGSSFIKTREAAAGGLAKIKAKDKLSEILERVTDNDSWVGYFAVKACGEICTPVEAEKLKESFGHVDENVKLAIVEALGKINADFSDFYMTILEDENEDIRKEVLAALANDNKQLAAEAAGTLFIADQSWIVRYKALEILINLKPEGYLDLLKKGLDEDDNKYVKEKIQSVLDAI
ncbi:PBS lyase HEAT domain protein repeat-containing protein [Denitrovibrio acetiphilus DSM 12809]|uniref:PBS lyase HEAT domain protein repeat-containing protein n=1 Tax=Denitrovibrio acetiphilus (strain DSM 12809 / NBRC 114555 / N2460) TaxID=522772 RepID=D4H6D5_DENA2|nr:HEAT repeat domain-containing protein [Denitrovibrio acetiphilus]ADD69609.1 PBS lyase HEAT domain protein repeat-containing protein [Denitrovibrio acetiphilus DSM 12809]